MQLIAKKTNIPIPRIHASSLGREKGLYSFVILDYVEGRTLFDVGFNTLSDAQRQHLYEQLASIYLQLRRLEFSSIGVLGQGADDSVDVRKKVASIAINEQELEGLQPSRIQAEHGNCEGVLTSAGDYASTLLRIARNAFERGRKSVHSEEDGNETLYNLDQFSQFTKKWLDHTFDRGPFMLDHGDLNPYNLMVNENIDIVALLDWEWACVVPLQFFVPPTWLTSRETDTLAWPVQYAKYVKELDIFRETVRDTELKVYGEELLSNEWARVHENGGILVQAALVNWTDMDYFAGRFLDKLLYQRKDLQRRIEDFIKEDPARPIMVARKIRDWKKYRAERKHLGINDPADNEIEEENMEIALATTCAWDSVVTNPYLWWSRGKERFSPKIRQILPNMVIGSSAVLFLAGACCIIWKCIIRHPFSR
ncbi:hypothetical protein G7Y89_g6249 [Cudoniella acicularis]|uniref:Aminoglycoside phosphotransferase domain-containing protein n=1 Tax=Cudoniella acicularis TaxID=354080 RepID=A0A8H4W320_9HELO|nr:hypothetical protein G7Y89_g6249 [Cudoniella acicularis]